MENIYKQNFNAIIKELNKCQYNCYKCDKVVFDFFATPLLGTVNKWIANLDGDAFVFCEECYEQRKDIENVTLFKYFADDIKSFRKFFFNKK